MTFVKQKLVKKTSAFMLLGAMLAAHNSVWAESDKQMQEQVIMAREKNKSGDEDHSAHLGQEKAVGQYRGVYYGYLPCQEVDCNGFKMTLSLNPKNNYLLITQPAKAFNRESFEKGKYQWDDNKGTVLLIPNKEAPQHRLTIKDDATLLYLRNGATPRPSDEDRYLLRRSDMAGNREMHMH